MGYWQANWMFDDVVYRSDENETGQRKKNGRLERSDWHVDRGLSTREGGIVADILISHVDEDGARVRELEVFLSKQGWTVWWNDRITPGDAFDMATEAELELATVVITVWSEWSVRSRLVRNTAYEAAESNRWIPLRFDNAKLPLRYREYQTINMVGWPDSSNDEGEQALLTSCVAVCRVEELELSHTATGTSVDVARELATTETGLVLNGEFSRSVDQSNGLREFATLRIGDWIIEEGQNRVRSGKRVKRLTPRSMQVLMFLVENREAPVSIGRILGHVWKDRVVVESVVHRCISELREAFEDDFKDPKYIETIAKRGYRVVGVISFL